MNYKETIVWQKAMAATTEVIKLGRSLPLEENHVLRRQMSRAAISVPSNLAEGWGRESRKEKAWFLSVAQGSLAEILTQLEICERVKYLTAEQLVDIRGNYDEVGRILTSLRKRYRAERSGGAT